MDHDSAAAIDKKPTSNHRFCSVPQCSFPHASKGISFHRFPLKSELREKWVCALKIGKAVTKFMVVCSNHFEKEDFFYFDENSKRRHLKKTSIPSCNLPEGTDRQTDGSHDRVFTGQQLNDQLKRTERLEARRRKAVLLSRINNECEVGCSAESIETMDNIQEQMTAADALLLLHSAAVDENVDTDSPKTFQDSACQVPEFIPPASITLVNFIKSDADLFAFTGIETMTLLHKITECAEMLLDKQLERDQTLDITERIVMTMVKIKLNISFTCISILFGISTSTCIQHFHTTLGWLSNVLDVAIIWPDKEAISRNMPHCFRNYSSTRIVLNCIETPVEKIACLNCRLNTYSHQKGCNTIKFLIGVAPEGLITFCSKAYGGRAPVKAIFLQSDLMSRLDPYSDAIMSDKGFLVPDECVIHGIDLISPPCLGKSKQFSVADGKRTAEIAQARAYVERVMQKIKIFKILKGLLPWDLVSCADDFIRVIAGIVNLSKSIRVTDKS